MIQQFSESQMGVNYSEALKAKNMLWDVQAAPNVASALFTSIADFLAIVKSKDQKVALEIQDHQGVFKMAGIVSYAPSDDEERPGEWELAFTFNQDDLEEVPQRYTIHDSFFQNVAAASSYKESCLQFNQITFMVDMFSVMAEEIYKWLDINAKDTEVVELHLDGYFVGKVAFEDGHKVIGLIPSEEIKQKVKHDADEKVA